MQGKCIEGEGERKKRKEMVLEGKGIRKKLRREVREGE